MSREYHGIPEGNGYDNAGDVIIVHNGEQLGKLDPRLEDVNHSPTGFAWSYGGSGPAQLAFAVLYDHTHDRAIARNLYQRFKWEVIAALERGPFVLTSDGINKWLSEQSNER